MRKKKEEEMEEQEQRVVEYLATRRAGSGKRARWSVPGAHCNKGGLGSMSFHLLEDIEWPFNSK